MPPVPLKQEKCRKALQPATDAGKVSHGDQPIGVCGTCMDAVGYPLPNWRRNPSRYAGRAGQRWSEWADQYSFSDSESRKMKPTPAEKRNVLLLAGGQALFQTASVIVMTYPAWLACRSPRTKPRDLPLP